jgi:hypothetical protein
MQARILPGEVELKQMSLKFLVYRETELCILDYLLCLSLRARETRRSNAN